MAPEFEGGAFFGIPDDLIRVLRKVSSSGKYDNENDPSKYPRAVEITDPYVLGWIAERDAKIVEATQLYDQIQLLISEIEVFKKKIFLKLKANHSHIASREREYSAFRKWEGKYYYVGWE